MKQIGDKVKIKSKNWYNFKKNNTGDIHVTGNVFVEDMSKYCGQIGIITKLINDNSYKIDLDDNIWFWTDEMVEPIEEIKSVKKSKVTKPKEEILEESIKLKRKHRR